MAHTLPAITDSQFHLDGIGVMKLNMEMELQYVTTLVADMGFPLHSYIYPGLLTSVTSWWLTCDERNSSCRSRAGCTGLAEPISYVVYAGWW